jgi:hypothetical protein
MLRTLLKRLLGREGGMPLPDTPPQFVDTPPAELYGPVQPVRKRHVLRRNLNGTLVLPGTTVMTQNNAMMKVAGGEQKPPYVRCIYRNRRLVVLPQNIGCHFDTVTEPIQ